MIKYEPFITAEQAETQLTSKTEAEGVAAIEASDWSVKGVKTFMGEDAPGYECSVYLSNRKVARANEYGGGGPLSITWLSAAAEEMLAKFGNKIGRPSSYYNNGGYYVLGADGVVEEMVSIFQERKLWMRKCKTKICYRTKDLKPGQHFEVKGIFTKDIGLDLHKKHGDNLDIIYNEKYGR